MVGIVEPVGLSWVGDRDSTRRCQSAPPVETILEDQDLELEFPSGWENWEVPDVSQMHADLAEVEFGLATRPGDVQDIVCVQPISGLPVGSPDIVSVDDVDVNTKEWTLTLWPGPNDEGPYRYEVPPDYIGGMVGDYVIAKLREICSKAEKTSIIEGIVLRNVLLLREYYVDVPAYFNKQIFEKTLFSLHKDDKGVQSLMYNGFKLGIPYVLSPACGQVFEAVFNPSGKKHCADKMLRVLKDFRRKYLNQLSAQRTNMANIRMRSRYTAMETKYKQEQNASALLRKRVELLESVVNSRDGKINEQQRQIALLAQRVHDTEVLLKKKRVQCTELERSNKRLRNQKKNSKT